MTDTFRTIAEAFSRTAAKYDAFAEDHPHLTRLREKVYAHVSRHVPTGSRILELNAGTGIDAVALAQRGYRVHATDISPGMLARAREKVEQSGLEEQVSVQECSFTDLDHIEGAPFDAVFSDLGGLNCIPDLSPVIEQLSKVLRPGGTVTWVLMPPSACGKWPKFFAATSDWPSGDCHAREHARIWKACISMSTTSHPAASWIGLGRITSKLELEGLSVITPTAESKNLAKRYPRVSTQPSPTSTTSCPPARPGGAGVIFLF
jgi:ubiquinone/menaquinone biosynthesis C-methylase UbiE